MRTELIRSLESTRYQEFLIYVMGAYKTHNGRDEEAFSFLANFRDDLRRTGFNAFLATDIEVPLDEMDAGTQTMRFARASNVVIFVIRHSGKNLGVGIEVGAVLEDMSREKRDRVLFLHESGIRSAMIGSVANRWDAEVQGFIDRDELIGKTKVFIADIAGKEETGELPFPPEE